MSTKIEKVRYAIFHNPEIIRTLMKDTSIKKGMIYHELNKILPCRVGIEFELSGNFNKGFFSDHTEVKVDDDSARDENEVIKYYYNLKDFSSDLCSSDSFNDDNLYEIRVSIDKYKHLSSLYRILNDINKYCNYHQNGGIHIHVDMTQYITPDNYSDSVLRELMGRYIVRRLDEIIKIFPKYTGSYNKKEVGIRRKKTYVNISRLGTLEFRIAPLTFDYTTLITWISGLMRFRRKLITELRLIKNHNLFVKENIITEDQDSESGGILPAPEVNEVLDRSYITDSIPRITNVSTNGWQYYDNSYYAGTAGI